MLSGVPLQEPNEEKSAKDSRLRQRIFAMFKHFREPHPEVMFISNFNALRPKYLLEFSTDEINAEFEKLKEEGLLDIEPSRFRLTEKGQQIVFGSVR
jgi:coproporphyrinogen III oxidase-like Fe-S oxidoreductase